MVLQGSDTLKHSRVADLKPREARPPDGFAVRASRLGEALAMRKRRLPKPERRDTDGYACGAQWVRYAALNRSKVAHDSSFMCSDKRGRESRGKVRQRQSRPVYRACPPSRGSVFMCLREAWEGDANA